MARCFVPYDPRIIDTHFCIVLVYFQNCDTQNTLFPPANPAHIFGKL